MSGQPAPNTPTTASNNTGNLISARASVSQAREVRVSEVPVDNGKQRCIGRGILIGLAAGLAGAWAMNQFWAIEAKFNPPQPSSDGGEESRQKNNPTVKVAEAIMHAMMGRDLKQNEKSRAGAIVHYAFGAAMGGAYGGLAELTPAATLDFGAAFGSTLWLVADELTVPTLGLSASARDYPLSAHISGLGAHLVYGITTESVRRALRAAL